MNPNGAEENMKKFCFTIAAVPLFLVWTAAQAENKVVVIPLNSPQKAGSADKLWGEARPGITTLTHVNPNGYCSTGSGLNFALSSHFATWGNAASVCPKDTWVCSHAEIGSEICAITLENSYSHETCDGLLVPDSPATQTSLGGWLADAHGNGPLYARFRKSGDPENIPQELHADYCSAFRVWCCWE